MWQGIVSTILGGVLFAAMPSSTNYGIHNYGFGSGGTSNSSSTSYNLNGTSGEVSGSQSTSTNYKARSGINNSQQANVPNAPTFTNPANYYNKLKFILNPGGSSPSDTKYSIAISNDNFVTTKYVQSDNTMGNTKVYKTYAGWGGASGQNVLALTYSTAYKVKVNAMQTNFTETEYGPVASASTAAPNITFSMYTDSQPSPPFSTVFGNLLPATVTTASNKIWVNLSTNAENGAQVYLNSANAGLKSTAKTTTISSATADLSSVSTGYGVQVVSMTQTTGGPLSSLSPFNGSTNNVGVLATLLKPIYSSAGPVTGGNAAFKLMAKAAQSTPAASDYADTVTLTAAAQF